MVRYGALVLAMTAWMAATASAEPWPAECRGPLAPSVVGGCNGVTHAGCCDPRGRVLYCSGNDLYCVDCAGQLPSCGWTAFGHYDCGTDGAVDPSGAAPSTCPATCAPACTSSSPCSTTCPGPCGHCAGGRTCLDDGACHQPECGDRECGVDAAGLSCGVCPHGTLCVEPLFACLPLPSGCASKRGPGCDDCGCEGCVCAKYPGCCQWNWDAFCAAACEQECGQDCQACPLDPQCAPGQCGPFCGVECGGCAEGQACHRGACCAPSCLKPDGSPKACGDDGCGGTCGACATDDECVDGACVACQPKCAGKQCGPDGCGGSCGACEPPGLCDDEGVCKAPNSCAGTCGGQADGCFCDPVCLSYGDCCDDFCQACPTECATDPCPGVPAVGCCQNEQLVTCVQGQAQVTDCVALGQPSCGWDSVATAYLCGTAGEESHQHPKACPATSATPHASAPEAPWGSGGLPQAMTPGACRSALHEVSVDASSAAAGITGLVGTVPDRLLVPPMSGMAFPPVVLVLALLVALLGCSGGEGNDRRTRHDTASQEIAETTPDVVADLPPAGDADLAEPRDDVDAAPDALPDTSTDARDASPETDASDGTGADSGPTPDPAEPAPDVAEPPAPDDVQGDAVDVTAETDTVEPYTCLHLPAGPLELQKVESGIAAEDLAFDGEGYLIGSDMSAVYKSAPGKSPKVFVPNLQTRAGMRMTPAGFLAVNDDTQGRLLLFGPDGTLNRVLLQGLAYPNGMVVDLDGFVYITEHNSGRVLRVHPYTGESTVLAEGLDLPNGIVFNADYTRLYIGTFGGATIWTMTVSRDGRPGRLELFADLSDTPGQLDGMGVDACGNVYVCEYGSTDIWRIAPDGKSKVRIVDSDPSFTYLPNLQWGRGEGWDPMSIYVPDGWNVGVWRVQVGVPSAPLPFP